MLFLPSCGRVAAQNVADGGGDPNGHDDPDTLRPLRADNGGCLPEVLPAGGAGTTGVAAETSCQIFEVLSFEKDESACHADPGRAAPDVAEVAAIRASEQIDQRYPICEIVQLSSDLWGGSTCAGSPVPGWCYVSGPAAGAGCSQAIRFSPGGTPHIGARVLLACP
jgi:hypothetical protein